MKIKWLGHSCFRLEESTGVAVVTDPFDGKNVGFEMEKVTADAVTVSHHHSDHDAVTRVAGDPQVLDELGSWDVSGVGISSLTSAHDETGGARRGNNLIFKYRMDGVDLCHMGDVGEESTPVLGEAIGTVNVLMIPVGGNYTIDARQAKEYVDFLMPDIVIPMHYKTPNCKMDLDKINAFVQLFEDEHILEAEGDELEFDRDKFDGESTKVVLFDCDKF